VSGDYGDKATLRSLLSGAELVVDLAYSTVPRPSFEDPTLDILSNLPASVQLLQEAASAHIRRLVLVSSGGTVYGVARSLPIPEDHPTNPISPYGITKLTIEKYAGMFGVASGLPIVIVRPGNAYGEGQHAFAGQGFIATAMHAILRRQAVVIFGHGGTIRDYVHVADVASGIVAALDSGEAGEIYNIGTAEARSNLDVLGEIEPLARAAGYELRTTTLPERAFDVPANVLDSRKLAAASGWRPGITFAQGIERAWRAVLDDPQLAGAAVGDEGT
jgi:UDP-glucose 4-epimerase